MNQEASVKLQARVMQVIEDLVRAGKIKRDRDGMVKAFVTDIDGTVGKWQLLISLLFMIAEVHHDKRPIIRRLHDAVMDYNSYNGTFVSVMDVALEILPRATEGLRMDMVHHMAAVVAHRDLSMIYAFSKALLDCLWIQKPDDRRLIIAITGTPQFLAEPFCNALHFDLPIGCHYYVDAHGRLTGERDEAAAIHKEEPLSVIRACNVVVDMAGGDTKTDVPIFLSAPKTCRLAVNPKPRLLSYIRDNPELNITVVFDHRSTGVQFFRVNGNGALREISRYDTLPPDIAYSLPNLPGEFVLHG